MELLIKKYYAIIHRCRDLWCFYSISCSFHSFKIFLAKLFQKPFFVSICILKVTAMPNFKFIISSVSQKPMEFIRLKIISLEISFFLVKFRFFSNVLYVHFFFQKSNNYFKLRDFFFFALKKSHLNIHLLEIVIQDILRTFSFILSIEISSFYGIYFQRRIYILKATAMRNFPFLILIISRNIKICNFCSLAPF